jgi:glycosyltransferase involved in cell wall biosynthesis
VKVGFVVPGGVDRSGTERVIPALLWLIERVARVHETHVFATSQGQRPGRWTLRGATIHDAGGRGQVRRTVLAIVREHGRGGLHVLHAFWAVPPGLAAVLAAQVIRRPVLLHVAGGETANLPRIGYGGSRTARGRWLLRRVLHAADAVTAASAPMVEALADYGIEAERVPLGVALDEWPASPPRPRVPGATARLVHVGSINAVKDQAWLLAAAAGLAREVPFTLDIIGGDTTGGAIKRLADRLGVADRCTFHGWLPHAAVRPLVERADVMVMASQHEAGPLAVLEAAVAGVPTVGTPVGHIAEWAPHAAVAVPFGDPGRFIRAVQRILADDARRLRIAREAQRRALAEDADATASRTLALYETLAAAHPRTRSRA